MHGIGPQPQWMHNPVTPSWSGNWGNAVQHRGVQRRMTQQQARAKRYAQNIQKRREADFAAQQRLQKEKFERARKEHLAKMATDSVYAADYRERLRKEKETQAQNLKTTATVLGLLGAAILSGNDDSAVPSITQQDRDDLRRYNMNRHRAIQEEARANSPWSQ